MFNLSTESVDILVRILIATLLGGLIGLERDIHGRAAGLRTHLLVSLGACVFMIVSELVSRMPDGSGYIGDPGRIAAQVITGIGFLGAGVIIKSGVNVRGLTTAACLWTAAGVGMATGARYYWIAGLTTVIAIASLSLLKYLEQIYLKDSYRVLSVTTPIDVEIKKIIDIVRRKNLEILSCDIKKNYDTGVSVTKMSICLFHRGMTDKLAHSIIESLESSDLVLKELKWDQT